MNSVDLFSLIGTTGKTAHDIHCLTSLKKSVSKRAKYILRPAELVDVQRDYFFKIISMNEDQYTDYVQAELVDIAMCHPLLGQGLDVFPGSNLTEPISTLASPLGTADRLASYSTILFGYALRSSGLRARHVDQVRKLNQLTLLHKSEVLSDADADADADASEFLDVIKGGVDPKLIRSVTKGLEIAKTTFYRESLAENKGMSIAGNNSDPEAMETQPSRSAEFGERPHDRSPNVTQSKTSQVNQSIDVDTSQEKRVYDNQALAQSINSALSGFSNVRRQQAVAAGHVLILVERDRIHRLTAVRDHTESLLQESPREELRECYEYLPVAVAKTLRISEKMVIDDLGSSREKTATFRAQLDVPAESILLVHESGDVLSVASNVSALRGGRKFAANCFKNTLREDLETLDHVIAVTVSGEPVGASSSVRQAAEELLASVI